MPRHSPFSPWLCLLGLPGVMAGLDRSLEPRELSLPAPIVIPASQDFDGNDGPWSSFALRLGTPAQTVKVMISTAGSQTWVVLPRVAPRSIRQIAQLRGAASLMQTDRALGERIMQLPPEFSLWDWSLI